MARVPNSSAQLTDPAGRATPVFRNFLMGLVSSGDGVSDAEFQRLAEQVRQLVRDVAGITPSQGLMSVTIAGNQIYLFNDVDDPGACWYYGTLANGSKGWGRLGDSFDVVAGELSKAIDPDTGVTTLGLADLADTGIGAALQKITRDAKGRVEGTSAATTDDLAEGAGNLYHTEARALEATTAVLSGTGDVPLEFDGGEIRARLSDPVVAAIPSEGTPADASAPGEAGTVLWDADYMYVCVATDVWKRVPLATW